jgi:arginine deiminase
VALHVYSEIGRLREVLVHAPGPEVDSMPPSMITELLFDDIIYGPRAREEHRRFRAVMKRLGVLVRDTQALLGEALEAGRDRIPALLEDIDRLERLEPEVTEQLRGLAPAALTEALVHGVPAPPAEAEPDYLFALRPLSNFLFTRDAQVVLGEGVLIGGMSRRARQREPLLSRFVFENHPDFKGTTIHADFLRGWIRSVSGNVTPTLEGGDLLLCENPRGDLVVVAGISERTMERALDRLVVVLRGVPRCRQLIMVPMPRLRSAMHLDTLFTRISRDECLVYGPMILPEGPETLSVVRIDLGRPDDWGVRRPSLLEALSEAGIELEPICCGGTEDYIQQAREQWTDGANSFALAPGVVMLYGRNEATARELEKHGYRTVAVSDMEFSRDGRCLYNFEKNAKYAILVDGEELSRARGGPRCMTMPLARDEL